MPMRSGYHVTIKGFIPTNPKDLAGHSEIMKAITDAKASTSKEKESPNLGDIIEGDKSLFPSADPMMALLEVETFDVKPVQRREEPA